MAAPIGGFDDEEKLYIDPIVGYRAFGYTLAHNNIVLTGQIWHEYEWKNGINEKTCLKRVVSLPGHHNSPGSTAVVVNEVEHSITDCSCGFYAYHHYTSVADSYGESRPFVLGVIEGVGQVFLGTKGFRVEKARVVAVCLPYSSRSWRAEQLFFFKEALLKSYPGLDIYHSPAEMTRAYPSTYLDRFRGQEYTEVSRPVIED